MIKRKFNRLVGLSFKDFNNYRESNQIIAQEARLIPLLKTGDEGALTSIFLCAIKLIKEYKDTIFREIKLSRNGKVYYFTEVTFKDIDEHSRIDGLIIIVSKGIIKEAAIFEMKNKNNAVNKDQIEKYIGLSKKIGVNRLITISNEFVSNPSQSPAKVKPPKNFFLFHFSWTYLITKGQLLLFKNDQTIQDDDQVGIMREVLYYLDNPVSGISGYHLMKPGWKETVDRISNRIPLKVSDACVREAVESWHQEEKDIALILSRQLGVFVKSSIRNKDSIKEDIRRVIKEQELFGSLSIKNSVSNIKIQIDFEVKNVAMSVQVIPPLNKGTKAKITWIRKQLEAAKKKNEQVFNDIEKDLLIEANIKHARNHIRIPVFKLDDLYIQINSKEIQAFNVVLMSKFKTSFGSNKNFIKAIEQMTLNYYAGIVQHLTNWNQPAPKL